MTKHQAISSSIEFFEPPNIKFGEVTLIDAYDSFTHNLVQAFLELGAAVKVFKCKEVEVNEVIDQIGEYLVLSPGPGIPSQAGIMKDIIQKTSGKIPMLGVCLGMQAINEVYGGKTIKSPNVVHGKTNDIIHTGTGLFSQIQSPTRVARYHSLQVSKVSDDFKIQSRSENVIMAFHNTELKICAVQFHPESFMTSKGMRMLLNFLEGLY